MTQVIHEVRSHPEVISEVLNGRRRFHVSLSLNAQPGEFIRLLEVNPKMSGEVPTGRQVFLRVSHLGDVYQTDAGKKIQEIWFQIAATENCSTP